MVNKHNVYNVGLKESENCPLPSHNAPNLPIRTPNDNTPVVIDPVTGQLYTRDPQVSPADLEAAEKRLGTKLEQKVEEETNDVVRKGETSVASAPDKIVVRDSAGHINIQYPTAGSHGANKTYVDDNIRAVRNEANANTLSVAKKFSDMAVDIDTKYADAKQYAENQIQAAVEAIVGDLAFTYDSYDDFIDSIMYTSDGTNLTFTGIISENGEEFTYDKLKKQGVQILIRQKDVPDYWLSRLIIPATEDIINFFTEFETKVNLNDYYNKEEIEQKLEDLDTTKRLTGEEIENGTFENGEIIYCTLKSEFFTANTYYIYTGNKFKPISTGSEISVVPLIKEFYLSTNPTSLTEIEVGRPLIIQKYWGTLKKSSDFSKLHLTTNISGHTAPFGETEVTPSGHLSFLVENLNYSIPTSGIGLTTSMSLKLVATLKTGSTLYISKSITTAGRQYFGILDTNPTLEVLTSEIATEYFGTKTYNSNTLKMVVDKTLQKNISLVLPETPSYIWFLVPMLNTGIDSIENMSSGGFDFPFIRQDNITITNSYGVDIIYEVYRSVNKVYGAVDIVLS
jgi:hypothetical protein